MPRRDDRLAEFGEALREVMSEREAAGESLGPDAITSAIGRKMGVVLVRIKDLARVEAPFPEPEGFTYPFSRARRMTAQRRDKLIVQLATGKRPETRRQAVGLLGSSLGDPIARDAIRQASQAETDVFLRGECLMCLGIAGAEEAEILLGAAQHLASEVAAIPQRTRAYDTAREGAAYGVLGALLAAARDGRRDLVGQLQVLAESLDGRTTLDSSDLPARQRRALLDRIARLDGASRT